IAASYDTNSFSRFYRQVEPGTRGMTAVVSVADGDAWLRSDPDQAATVINIGTTPIFAALKTAQEGSWQGSFGPDDKDRIYAFTTVPDRGLKLVVGVDRAGAMSGADAWEQNAQIFAGF